MKISLLGIVYLLSSAVLWGDSTRDIKDVELIKRRSDSFYDVLCRSGKTEIVSAEDIRNGQICGGIAAFKKITCTGVADVVYPTRGSDGKKLGSATTAKTCREISESAIGNTVCTSLGSSNWWVTRIEDENRIGSSASLDDCLVATQTTQQNVVCAPHGGNRWRLVRDRDLGELGMSLDLKACVGAVISAREGVICAGSGSNFWEIIRIRDGKKLGMQTDFGTCTLSTRKAEKGKVCVNRGPNRWELTEIETEVKVGEAVGLDACITQRTIKPDTRSHCGISVMCLNGRAISCEANGERTRCDSSPNYVQCQSWDLKRQSYGRLQVLFRQRLMR